MSVLRESHLNRGNDLATVLFSAMCIGLLVKQLFLIWLQKYNKNFDWQKCGSFFMIYFQNIFWMWLKLWLRTVSEQSNLSFTYFKVLQIFAEIRTFAADFEYSNREWGYDMLMCLYFCSCLYRQWRMYGHRLSFLVTKGIFVLLCQVIR